MGCNTEEQWKTCCIWGCNAPSTNQALWDDDLGNGGYLYYCDFHRPKENQ